MACSYIYSVKSYSLFRSYGLCLQIGLVQYVSYLTAEYILDLGEVMDRYVGLSRDFNPPGFKLSARLAEPLPKCLFHSGSRSSYVIVLH